MRWVVNGTPGPLYLRERPNTHCTEGVVSNRKIYSTQWYKIAHFVQPSWVGACPVLRARTRATSSEKLCSFLEYEVTDKESKNGAISSWNVIFRWTVQQWGWVLRTWVLQGFFFNDPLSVVYRDDKHDAKYAACIRPCEYAIKYVPVMSVMPVCRLILCWSFRVIFIAISLDN